MVKNLKILPQMSIVVKTSWCEPNFHFILSLKLIQLYSFRHEAQIRIAYSIVGIFYISKSKEKLDLISFISLVRIKLDTSI